MHNYSPYITENLEFLNKLSKTKSEQKKRILLLNSTTDQILAIVEICHNVLKFNFPLNRRQKHKLAKFADFYRSLSRTRTENGARKRLQKGSGVALAAILIPVVSAIAQALVERGLK